MRLGGGSVYRIGDGFSRELAALLAELVYPLGKGVWMMSESNREAERPQDRGDAANGEGRKTWVTPKITKVEMVSTTHKIFFSSESLVSGPS